MSQLPPSADTSSSDVRAQWNPRRSGGGYRANALMLWISRRCYWLSYVLVWFIAAYFMLVPSVRRASMAYLDRLFPARSALRRWADTYRHILTYSFLLLDRAVMLAAGPLGFNITASGLEHIEAAIRHPGGVLLLTAHFGNAEASLPYLRAMGMNRSVHIVMYQDSADKTEHFHSRHRRLLAGIDIISTRFPLLAGPKIVASLRRGEWVAIRADRTLRGKSVTATLLGTPVRLPSGPFTAAVLCEALVLRAYMVRRGYRRYECITSSAQTYLATPDSADGDDRDAVVARVAQEFAADLETHLRRFPLQWANFYDFWSVQSAVASSTNSSDEASSSPK